MSTPVQTIEARAGTPGAMYQTKSGHKVRLLRIEPEQVILQAPEQQQEIPVPSFYLLQPVTEEPVEPAAPVEQTAQLGPDGQPRMQVRVEELVMAPRNVIEPAILRLSTPDLEQLADLDARMFVVDLIGKEMNRRAAAAGHVAPPPEPPQGVSIHATVKAPELVPHPIAAQPDEAPMKPRRIWIMLLRDEMLVEFPGRRALMIPYEGEAAPLAWHSFRAASPPEGYDGPEPGEPPVMDALVRAFREGLRGRLVDGDPIDLDGWEFAKLAPQAITEARLAVEEGGTPRGLSSSRDQAALVKDVSSLTGLGWMIHGSVQPTTKREIERQARALEGLLECSTIGELEKWAQDKRAKPLERPGVARRYKRALDRLQAIEEAVPALAWCQEYGFSFELDGEEQDVGCWLDGNWEETTERIRAAGAAARAVRARQLADQGEREAPPAPPVDEARPTLRERIERFVGSGEIPEWITRETFSERCFDRLAVLCGDHITLAGPLLDRTTDMKILETARAFLEATDEYPERLQLIREQILDAQAASGSVAVTAKLRDLSQASLAEQLSLCSQARALELLAAAEYPRDVDAVTRGMGTTDSPKVRQECRRWLNAHAPTEVKAAALEFDAEQAAHLAEVRARAAVALGQFSAWPIEVFHQTILDDGGYPAPDWCLIATTPHGHRRAGHSTTLEGAAAELRVLLEQEFPSPTPPPPADPVAEKDEQPDPTSEPIELGRVILVQLPDGGEDLWYDSPRQGRVLMGPSKRPDLKPIATAARQHQAAAQVAAAQQQQADMTASAVRAAQAALSALAVGLPAMAQLGIDVDIRIITRRPMSADRS